MSNVTHLPDSMQRQWRVYEAGLRKHFGTHGASSAELEYAVATLKPIFLKAASPVSFSGELGGYQLLKSVNEWVYGQIYELLLHVALRDAELYRLRGASPPTPGP